MAYSVARSTERTAAAGIAAESTVAEDDGHAAGIAGPTTTVEDEYVADDAPYDDAPPHPIGSRRR